MLKIMRSIDDARKMLHDSKRKGLSTGLIPTMGALHEGHLSLVKQAQRENDEVVVSIFVNPLQFGKDEDFNRYPRSFDKDCEVLSSMGVDLIFNPTASEMYPPEFSTGITFHHLEKKLCGKFRPGHFGAVAVVVLKLFLIVNPDRAYFGQKDFQQTVIVKRMVADFNLDVEIKVLPTMRNADGLALSSRNVYLNNAEKREALCLYQALTKAQSLVNAGIATAMEITQEMEKIIRAFKTATLDYISIVNPDTLEETQEVYRGSVVALAVKIGKTRLIDNIIIV